MNTFREKKTRKVSQDASQSGFKGETGADHLSQPRLHSTSRYKTLAIHVKTQLTLEQHRGRDTDPLHSQKSMEDLQSALCIQGPSTSAVPHLQIV